MIKVLKAVCSIFGTMFCTCMITVGFLFNGDAISLKEAIFYIAIFALLTFACMLAHWILTDHERNPDWLDYLNEIAKEE